MGGNGPRPQRLAPIAVLAFIVGLHVATAAALLVFFWRDWLRVLADSYPRCDMVESRLPTSA